MSAVHKSNGDQQAHPSAVRKFINKLGWTPDTDVPRAFEVSTWVKAAGSIMNSKWPAWLQPSKKNIEKQTWGERAKSLGKFALRGIGKLVVGTATALVGAGVAGMMGGAIQTLVGIWRVTAPVVTGVAVGVLFGLSYLVSDESPDIKLPSAKSIAANFLKGVGDLVLGPLKMAVGAATVLGFMTGIGALPTLATIVSATTALGPTAAALLSQGLAVGKTVSYALGAAASTGLLEIAVLTVSIVVLGTALTVATLVELGAKAIGAIKGWWQQRSKEGPEISKQAEPKGPSTTPITAPKDSPTTSKPRTDLQSRLSAAEQSSTAASRTVTDPSSSSPSLLSSSHSTSAAPAREMTSSTKVTISEPEVQKINQKIQSYEHTKDARLSVQDGTPTFKGRDPVSALASCENRELQRLSYALILPKGSTQQQANELLSKAKDVNISEVQIGSDKFKVDKIEGGGYKVKPLEPPRLVSQRQAEAQQKSPPRSGLK